MERQQQWLLISQYGDGGLRARKWFTPAGEQPDDFYPFDKQIIQLPAPSPRVDGIMAMLERSACKRRVMDPGFEILYTFPPGIEERIIDIILARSPVSAAELDAAVAELLEMR
jgi:hypothetical protein